MRKTAGYYLHPHSQTLEFEASGLNLMNVISERILNENRVAIIKINNTGIFAVCLILATTTPFFLAVDSIRIILVRDDFFLYCTSSFIIPLCTTLPLEAVYQKVWIDLLTVRRQR